MAKQTQTGQKSAGLDYGKMDKIEIPESGERICPVCKGIIQLDRDREDLVVKDNWKRNRYFHRECILKKMRQQLIECHPAPKFRAEKRIDREDAIELLEFSNMHKVPKGGQ